MHDNQVVFIDERAGRILGALDRRIQTEFHTLFNVLKSKGKLEYPSAKKITKNLFEIRIKAQNQVRGIYAYLKLSRIIILHIFIKKTRKTPKKEIITALKRLQQYG